MAKAYIKYSSADETAKAVQLDNVVDVGIANDFLVIRYKDGVVTFTKTDLIDDVQFDPTEDQVEENTEDNGEAQNNPPSE